MALRDIFTNVVEVAHVPPNGADNASRALDDTVSPSDDYETDVMSDGSVGITLHILVGCYMMPMVRKSGDNSLRGVAITIVKQFVEEAIVDGDHSLTYCETSDDNGYFSVIILYAGQCTIARSITIVECDSDPAAAIDYCFVRSELVNHSL